MSGLPSVLKRVLPTDTAKSWMLLRNVLPSAMVLHGGTAIAAHLGHRKSQDLDFFFDDPSMDLHAVQATLASLRPTAVTKHDMSTLNVVFGRTKVQFLSMSGQVLLDHPAEITGLQVASLRDLAATKLKVIGDRGELRDYFDLMRIEEQTHITAESALLDYQERYDDRHNVVHLVMALGYLGDVANDPGLPVARTDIEHYWGARQSQIAASLDRTGTIEQPRSPGRSGPSAHSQQPAGDSADTLATDGGHVWVPEHARKGRKVRGHWRRR